MPLEGGTFGGGLVGAGGGTRGGFGAFVGEKEPSEAQKRLKQFRKIARAAQLKRVPLAEALAARSPQEKLFFAQAPVRIAREAGFGTDVAGFLLSFAPEIVAKALEDPRAGGGLGGRLLTLDPKRRLQQFFQPEGLGPRVSRGVEVPVVRGTLPGTPGRPLPPPPVQQPTVPTPQGAVLRILFELLCQFGVLPSPPCPPRPNGGEGGTTVIQRFPQEGGRDVPLLGGEGGGGVLQGVEGILGTLFGDRPIFNLGERTTPVPGTAGAQLPAITRGVNGGAGVGVLAPIVPHMGTPPQRQTVIYMTPGGNVRCANYQREPQQAWRFVRKTKSCRGRR